MKWILMCCLGWGMLMAQAQGDRSAILQGVIQDSASEKPIPYATIQIEDLPYGAVANAEGAFSLSIPNRFFSGKYQLRIKCIGYDPLAHLIRPSDSLKVLRFSLTEHPYSLNDVVISSSDLGPAGLVARAFEKIPQNFNPDPYQLRTFYRHYCQEDGRYGRLIEAAVRLYEPKGHRKLYGWPGKKVELEVEQLRRSFDFTYLYPNSHTPIALYKVLSLDWTSYASGIYRKPDHYQFTMLDTTYYDGHWVYVIGFERDKGGVFGELYLSADNLAFVKVNVTVTTRLMRKDEGMEVVTEYKEWQTTSYKKQGDHFYLSHLVNKGERFEKRYDAAQKLLSTDDHYHHVELMTGEVIESGFKKFKGKEPNRKEMLEIPYDEEFWRNYPVLQATPIERKIEQDLADRMPLEEQYERFNVQKGAIVLEGEEMFDRLIWQQRGRIIYVQFYSGLALGKLQATRKLAKKKYNDGRVGVFFVYVDEDGDGLPALIKDRPEVVNSGLLLLVQANSPLLARYSIEETPHFMILDREGKVAIQDALAPDEKGVEDQIDRLLRQSD